ncbi:NADPH:adrenodoxin oxidoreductase, mitochondrial isoform X2 [Arctopsyche grandis]|uniref:NADPH:adrenodoxin oxidoreductase, mitochondrial isoform X2 n=1 Tax=Arctopsyche grandis TaxID=121162 RepID=UPI00406D6731
MSSGRWLVGSFAMSLSSVLRVCVVGAGPGGFYAAQHLAKHLPNATVDIIEKLPVPFGLVRFGVAPDHPEVKNVINTFTKVAESKNVNFYGNITLGKDITLTQLKDNYHAVLLAYGAEHDKQLNIPNEKFPNVLSARNFVGWYNGVPTDQNLEVDLSGSSAAILGQGNVAMDVARILLTPVDILKKTDITENALAVLSDSKIKNVHLIGRRGPLQAAFTIKELRELIKLPMCKTVWREKDFIGIAEVTSGLARPKKRITELMLKSLSEMNASSTYDKRFLPVFCRSPLKFLTTELNRLVGVELALNQLIGDDLLTQTCVKTEQREILNCDLALRSIGYKSIQADPDIHFDFSNGRVANEHGRIISKDGNGVQFDKKIVDPGLYVSGWLRTGPVGVILTTMSNAFEVAANICKDFDDSRNFLRSDVKKGGFASIRRILEKNNVQIVHWEGWEKIDKYEIELGSKSGKPREKICDVSKMLDICS